MQKRGQVAIWVIIAIVILVLVILGLYFKDEFLNFLRDSQLINRETIPKAVEPVNNFILSCIKTVGEESLSYVGVYGGYYNPSEKVKKNNRGIPYYYYKNNLIIPPKTLIERSLSAYFNENLDYCVGDFSDFNKSFNIKSGKVNSKVVIDKGKVIFNVKYPVTLKKNENEYQLKSFVVDVNSNLNLIYYSIVVSLNEQKLYPEGICLSCLYDVANKNNLKVETYNPEKGEVEYIFIDYNVSILDEPQKFVIALKFDSK